MPQSTIFNPVVPWRATVVYRGERNAKFAWFRESVPVSVVHADRADFSPAVVIRDFSFTQGVAEHATLFSHDGALWTPMVRLDGSPVGIDFFRNQVEAEYDWRVRDAFRHTNPFSLGKATVRTDEAVRTFNVPPGDRNTEGPARVEETRRIVSSDEERARTDVGRIAEAIRIVDGEVWYRCYDPYWVAPAAKAVLTFGPEGDLAHHHYGRVPDMFRGDRLEELVAWRQAYRAISPVFSKPLIESTHGAIEIMDRSCFSRDDLRYMMRGFMSMVDTAFAFMQRSPAPIVAKWAEVRDEAQLLERHWTREGAMSALEGFKVVWEECKRSEHLGHGYQWDDWKKVRKDWLAGTRELMTLATWHEGLAASVDLSTEDLERIEAFSGP